MSDSKYFVPRSLSETVSLLAKHKRKARLMAGGTDLVVRIKKKEIDPEVLISIAGINELNYITFKPDEGLKIGALTPLTAIESSPVIKDKFPVLAYAAGTVGSPIIRSRATIGGNLCNAAPSADTAPALIALGANVKLVSARGERLVQLEDFFAGPGKTILKPDEVLAEILVPTMPAQSAAVYVKQKRRIGADLAVVGVAAMVSMVTGICSSDIPYLTNTVNTSIGEVKIVLGAVAPTPIRAKKAEALLKSKPLDEKLLEELAQAAAEESKPIDDCRSCARYRKEMVAVLTRRAIELAIGQVKLEV